MTPTLTVLEATKILHIGENEVRNLINAGELPAARLGKGFTLLMDDVLEYVRQTAQQQTKQRRDAQQGTTVSDVPTTQRRRQRTSDRLVKSLGDG